MTVFSSKLLVCKKCIIVYQNAHVHWVGQHCSRGPPIADPFKNVEPPHTKKLSVRTFLFKNEHAQTT